LKGTRFDFYFPHPAVHPEAGVVKSNMRFFYFDFLGKMKKILAIYLLLIGAVSRALVSTTFTPPSWERSDTRKSILMSINYGKL
jgi:hypothetical protein